MSFKNHDASYILLILLLFSQASVIHKGKGQADVCVWCVFTQQKYRTASVRIRAQYQRSKTNTQELKRLSTSEV